VAKCDQIWGSTDSPKFRLGLTQLNMVNFCPGLTWLNKTKFRLGLTRPNFGRGWLDWIRMNFGWDQLGWILWNFGRDCLGQNDQILFEANFGEYYQIWAKTDSAKFHRGRFNWIRLESTRLNTAKLWSTLNRSNMAKFRSGWTRPSTKKFGQGSMMSSYLCPHLMFNSGFLLDFGS